MMLDPRAIALQGIGYSPFLVAVQGFGEAAAALSYIEANERAYGKSRRRDYNPVESGENVDWALQLQIKQEDEIVVALVMAAAPILGETKWRQ